MNVLVTGASSGLGACLVRIFRASGEHTVLGTTHDRDLTVRNPELLLFKADSFVQHTAQVLAKKVAIQFDGRVDVLINNIGENDIRPFEEVTPEFLRHLMTVNFETPVFLTQAFLPFFSTPATVINIVSDAAWRPMRHSLAYNCSKAALDMATKQLARELTKPRGISFIGIRPGKMGGTHMSTYIDRRVQQVRGWSADEAVDYFKMNSLTGLEFRPEDVAVLIYNIATNIIARNMSGACLDLVG
jgi:NAD(P)-dependent dehydrogenase (short-subunit alcohol dehydrogenase family)